MVVMGALRRILGNTRNPGYILGSNALEDAMDSMDLCPLTQSYFFTWPASSENEMLSEDDVGIDSLRIAGGTPRFLLTR